MGRLAILISWLCVAALCRGDGGQGPLGGTAASPGEPSARDLRTLWDLASANPADHEDIFRSAVTPRLEDFRGRRFNGIILYVQKWEFGKLLFTQYTGRSRDLITGKLYSQPLTFRKRFHERDDERGQSGINYWPVRRVESMPMRIYLAPGVAEGSSQSLMIDYNVAANRAVVERPLLDEVRRIAGTQLYIGRMYYRVRDFKVPFLWFALERAD